VATVYRMPAFTENSDPVRARAPAVRNTVGPSRYTRGTLYGSGYFTQPADGVRFCGAVPLSQIVRHVLPFVVTSSCPPAGAFSRCTYSGFPGVAPTRAASALRSVVLRTGTMPPRVTTRCAVCVMDASCVVAAEDPSWAS